VLFVPTWAVFFRDVHFGNFVIGAHFLSWLVLIVTDEVGILRGLAAVTLVVTFFIFVGVLFNYLLHQTARGFLKDK
jgi:hypothetical protein